MRRHGAIAALVVVAFGLAGCRRKPPPPPPRPAQSARQAAQAGKAVVVAYLNHLDKAEYRAAWALLSRESQAQHPYDTFAEQARKGGPLYDTGAAAAKAAGKGRVVVSIPHVEDPARVTFEVAQEADRWRLVYRSGRPWTPYP
jgi:hypothetical protein